MDPSCYQIRSIDCEETVQYVLPPGSVVYAGTVGDDDLAEQLKAANRREGLDEVYHVIKGEKTGACGVIITGHNRSVFVFVRTGLGLTSIQIARDNPPCG